MYLIADVVIVIFQVRNIFNDVYVSIKTKLSPSTITKRFNLRIKMFSKLAKNEDSELRTPSLRFKNQEFTKITKINCKEILIISNHKIKKKHKVLVAKLSQNVAYLKCKNEHACTHLVASPCRELI